MKGGIIYSDIVNTVSQSYADEIRTPYYGENLDGLLNGISYKLYGIVNGIDHDAYNPRRDKDIPKTFGLTTMKNKLVDKEELQKQLGLPVDKNIPVIGLVSRLVSQKGLDLIKGVIEEILNLDIQLVILGSGEQTYEDLFEYYSHIYPKKLSSNIGFSDKLAKLIYAGADMFLMPSLFEPCGIGQLIALRYGTVPIVRETGGLKDTITPYNKYTGEGNGFSFTNYNAHDMLNVIQLAIETFKDKKQWLTIQKNGMKAETSWKDSAKKYNELYKKLV